MKRTKFYTKVTCLERMVDYKIIKVQKLLDRQRFIADELQEIQFYQG